MDFSFWLRSTGIRLSRPEGMLDLRPRQNRHPDEHSTTTDEEEDGDDSSSSEDNGDDDGNDGGTAPQVIVFYQTQDGKGPLDALFTRRPAIPPPRYVGRYSMWDAPPNM